MAAFAAFAGALTLQASCVAAFGVDVNELHNAVAEMCDCDLLQKVDSCESTLTGRLDGASSTVQSAWLARYVNECLDCGNAPRCLAEIPTCTLDKCKIAAECCTLGEAGKATCVDLHCKQP